FAEAASSALLKDAKSREGEVVQYRVCAFPGDGPARPPEPGGPLSAFEEPQPLPVDDVPLEEFLGRARLQGGEPGEEIPVFVPRAVLSEAAALKEEAGDVETGGVLIGH